MTEKNYSGNVLALETWDERFDNMEGCVVHYIGVAESPYDWGGSLSYKSVIEKGGNTIFKILRWMIIQVVLILQVLILIVKMKSLLTD